ncbi:Uncharacterised protein r2_g2385 [Pycnogonum litorale]
MPSSTSSAKASPILTDTEVITLLKNLKNKNSRGHDGVSGSILRNYRHLLVNPIKNILNQCLELHSIPDSWKMIKITPIPKVNVNTITDPKQVRPIGQTPTMLKVLEYYLKNNLSICITNLDQNQFGYRNKVSNVDAINFVTNTVVNYLDEKHSAARILLLDYSSAFNTINRQEILNIIGTKYDTPFWLLKIMTSYLEERCQ